MSYKKYRIYIDESGNPDLKSSDNPNHRFLSLTGIIMDLNYVATTFQPQMEKLKSKYFEHHPDDPVILHREEVINKKGRFIALREKNIEERFNRDLLTYLKNWEYAVITVCLDKKAHKEIYTIWRYNPYHYCLEVLLERYIFFLEQKQVKGDVIAESRGGKEDIRMKKSFERLFRYGTEYIKPDRFSKSFTSCELKVKPKKINIAGLQLADILANPSRCEILNEQGLLGRKLGDFTKKIIDILKDKYYQPYNRIPGYGKKFLGYK